MILVRTRKAGQGKAYDRESPGFSHMAWDAENREEVDSLYEILKATETKEEEILTSRSW